MSGEPIDRGAEETVEIRPPEATVQMPAASGRLHPGIWIVFVAVAFVAFIAGAVAAAATRTEDDGRVVAQAEIGPGGGTLRFGSVGQLRIPPRSLTGRHRFTVRRTVIGERLRVHAPEGTLHVFEPNELAAYSFAPRDVTFARPASVVLPLEEPERNGAAFAAANGTVLFLDGTVDPDAGTVTVEISDLRFSTGRAAGGET